MIDANALSLIGKEALLSVEKSLVVRVKIVALRENYGRIDYYVTPISGTGEQWVQSSRCAVVTDSKENN